MKAAAIKGRLKGQSSTSNTSRSTNLARIIENEKKAERKVLLKSPEKMNSLKLESKPSQSEKYNERLLKNK